MRSIILTRGLLVFALLSLRPAVGIRVDGRWSPWSTIKSPCVLAPGSNELVACGGGVQSKYRSCSNPSRQGGGKDCVPEIVDGVTISKTKYFPCHTHPCALPEEFSWSEWSECSNICGRGEQRRVKLCGSIRQRLPLMTAEHAAIGVRPATVWPTIPATMAPGATKGPATTKGPAATAGPAATTGPATTTAAGGAGTTTTEAATTTAAETTAGRRRRDAATTTTAAETTAAATTTEGSTTTAGGSTTTAGGSTTTGGSTVAGGSTTTAGGSTAEVGSTEPAAPGAGGSGGGAGGGGGSASGPTWIDLWELEFSEDCMNQPPEVREVGQNQTVRDCNTWRYYPEHPSLWNHTNCPDPCYTYKCPKFAKCSTAKSTKEDKVIECICQMGTVMKADNSSCIVPPPTTPTPRPIPTLPPAQKTVATAATRGACTIIIIFLSATLIIFLVFRVFDPARVIQMCEEISLLCAHLCMLPPNLHEQPHVCRVISILVHYFFTACFTFMLLEGMHMYAQVASVVKSGGILSTKQNVFIGFGIPAFIILFNMCFEYENYGGAYHCWLQMDQSLMYGQYIPIITMVVATFTLIEAAGASDDYPALKGRSEVDRTTAAISQRTLLIILPLVFSSFVIGTLAEFEQNLPLYGTFTILNGVTGGVIFFFHLTGNESTRRLVNKIRSKLCGGKKDDK